jgi:tetratricopeptide (TPR) repeat protein
MIRPPAPPAGEQQGAAAAAALKDAGNAHFQAKRFEEALECYTRALALAPHNHLLWSNSSMARAALNQWFESEAVSYFRIRDL